MPDRPRLAWWKLFAVWGTFLALHFSYDAYPSWLFRILAEDHEATFSHMKMLFVAYVVVSLIELVVRRKKLRSISSFVYSRALIAVVFPWLTITLWFTAEALGFRIPIIPWEIIYANVFTALGIYMALRMEELFADTEFRPAMKGLIILAFAAAVLSYVSFSIHVPVHFFTTPPE